MPADFDPKNISLRKLRVEVVNGVVWATFSDDTPPFREYLGERFWQHYTRVYDGRKLQVLGYNRQHIPGNWKLMQENIKDPYHASLLHVFFVTFGLFRADQKSATEVDPTGRHGILISRTGRQEINDVTSGMRTFRSDITLADPRIMDVVKEYPGDDTVGMITVFPSVVLQQNQNSLSIRHIVPTGPGRVRLPLDPLVLCRRHGGDAAAADAPGQSVRAGRLRLGRRQRDHRNEPAGLRAFTRMRTRW